MFAFAAAFVYRAWNEIATETGWTNGTVQRAFYGQKVSGALAKIA